MLLCSISGVWAMYLVEAMHGPVGLAGGFPIYHSAWGACLGRPALGRGQELRASQEVPWLLTRLASAPTTNEDRAD